MLLKEVVSSAKIYAKDPNIQPPRQASFSTSFSAHHHHIFDSPFYRPWTAYATRRSLLHVMQLSSDFTVNCFSFKVQHMSVKYRIWRSTDNTALSTGEKHFDVMAAPLMQHCGYRRGTRIFVLSGRSLSFHIQTLDFSYAPRD